MIARYKQTLLKLFTQVQRIHANPNGSHVDCLTVQETLIQKITYVERQIRKKKEAIKNLKKHLGSQDTVHLNKEEAKRAKEKIDKYQFQIDEYQELASRFREVGDALAFSYINKWDIKPLVFKETAGALLGKKGARLERKILRGAFATGHIALLNDITNCLRYGDITLLKGGKFMILEAKSGKRWTERDQRQFDKTDNIFRYLQTDRTQKLYKIEGEFRRHALHSQEIHYRNRMTELVSKALADGNAVEEVECGLFYMATTQFNPVILTTINEKLKGQPIAALVNQIGKNNAYYPIMLSISNPEALYRFYTGELTIIVIVDTGVIEEKLKPLNLSFRLTLNNTDWMAEITNAQQHDNEFSFLKMSYMLWNRLYTEFLSLDWFLDEMINFVKLNPSAVEI